MVQMMLAIMKFQVATRNRDSGTANSLHEQSNAHYHYALTLLHELVASHTLQDIQAISVICIHLRSFPNPGAAWMLSNWTLGLAIEMGLHRSADVRPGEDTNRDGLEIQTRKHIFWSLLTIITTVGGKLGRPMPLTIEDFDIELPEPSSDNLPSEEGLSDVPQCSFQCGVELFKLTQISLQTYASIYSIRRRPNYEETVRSLERKVEAWKKQLPPKLTEGSDASKEPENRVLAVWMEYVEAEYQLVLHHPARCTSSSRPFIQRNLDICSKAASKLIRTVAQLHELNALDFSWNGTNTHIAAMFTLLFVYWERRDQISAAELHKLKAELGICLDIIGFVSQILGAKNYIHTFSGNPLLIIPKVQLPVLKWMCDTSSMRALIKLAVISFKRPHLQLLHVRGSNVVLLAHLHCNKPLILRCMMLCEVLGDRSAL